MKRFFTTMISAAAIATLAACGGSGGSASSTSVSDTMVSQSTASESDAEASGEPIELIVFAAASMTETMEEIAQLYSQVAPNVTIVYTFDSSGTLATQIEEGADCDLFISAAPKQMNQIDINGGEDNPDGLDFVLEDTRIDLLENKVVLVTADNSDSGITSFEDLTSDKLTLLCIGNEDVPVGDYSLKILEYLGTSAQELEAEGKLTYGSNVKEVTTQVSEGTVDCGIIYATDAFSAGLTPVDEATAQMCGQVIYPAAVMKNSENIDAAKAFLEYLQGDEAKAVFESVGFTPLT